VRGGDPILISERLATRSLAQWDRIATRVVEVGSGAPPRLNPSVEERRTIIHDGLDRHYRDLLDQPIPVLGNKSPRAAVKTPKGRAKVVDWLKTLENHTAKFAGSNDEMASYNTMIKCGRSTSGASRMTSTGWQQSLLGNGAVQRARPLPRHLHPLSQFILQYQ